MANSVYKVCIDKERKCEEGSAIHTSVNQNKTANPSVFNEKKVGQGSHVRRESIACSFVVEPLSSTCKGLGLIPSTGERGKKKPIYSDNQHH